MQTSSFGAILAGYVGKSSGFYVPAEQEMLPTGTASPVLLLRKGEIPPPLVGSAGSVSKQAQSKNAGASLQNKDKAHRVSPRGDKAHTGQWWHPRRS